MHEASIAQAVLETALAALKEKAPSCGTGVPPVSSSAGSGHTQGEETHGQALGAPDGDAHAATYPPSYKITKIVIVAGVLAGVERECLKTFFDIISEGTAAAGAEIELRPEPAKLICRQCGHTTEHTSAQHVEVNCQKCGGQNKLKGGSALYVESIEAQ
jgi:hydrogenase nickel incorporation protein HypA/HybF